MILFEKITPATYRIKFGNGQGFDLPLIVATSLTKNFGIVTSCISDMAKVFGQDFEDYIHDFFVMYHRCNTDQEKIDFFDDEADLIIGYSNIFVDRNGVDYSTFDSTGNLHRGIDLPYNVKKIIKLSVALKICSLFFNTRTSFKAYGKEIITLLEERYKKHYEQPVRTSIYTVLGALDGKYDERTTKVITTESGRISLVLPAKAYRPSFDISEVAARLTKKLPILEHDNDPIQFFLDVIKQVRREIWLSKNPLEGAIFQNVEGKDDFSWDGVSEVEQKLFDLGERITVLHSLGERVKEVEYLSPFWEFMVLPILKEVIDLKEDGVKKLLNLNPKIATPLTFHIGLALKWVLANGYPYLLSLSSYYPTKQPQRATKYRMRGVARFVHLTLNLTNEDLMRNGFLSRVDFSRRIESFVGVMRNSRLRNIVNASEIVVNVRKLEEETMDYFFFFHFTDRIRSKLVPLQFLIQ